MYQLGAIKNAEQALTLYPDWQTVFYCGASIPPQVVTKLLERGAIVERVEEPESCLAMLWRFRAIHINDASFVVFRDTDSRLTQREAALVSQWMESSKDLHIIRDHPWHSEAIMGGMWGARAEKLRDKFMLVSPDPATASYGVDQEYLRRHVYRNQSLSRIIHDSVFVRELNSRFLAPADDGSFIGEVIGDDSRPESSARLELKMYRTQRRHRIKVQLSHFKKLVFYYLLDKVNRTD